MTERRGESEDGPGRQRSQNNGRHASRERGRAADPAPGRAADPDSAPSPPREQRIAMNVDAALKEAMSIDGAIGAALVDYTSGMALGTLGASKDLDLTVAAAGNTEVVRAKARTMEMLKMNDTIEDILITLGKQYHVIRPLTGRNGSGLFMYLALDKSRSNLAMSRHQLRSITDDLDV
jgi:hypothetical protein